VRHWISLYADDLVVFISPTEHDIRLMATILDIFARASGLHTKAELHPFIDVVADRLPNWKGKLMSRAGRTTLTKVTLSAIPIHISIVVVVGAGIYRAIDKIHRVFIWNGNDPVHGGKCLVSWSRVT
jgi:hypothetical protein